MAGTTTNYSLPYPESTDLVASYPALGQDLAEDLDTILASKAPIASPTFTGTVTIPGVNLAAWTSYTPALGNGWAVGNGTAIGKYAVIGRVVHFSVKITFGSTSTFAVTMPYVQVPAPHTGIKNSFVILTDVSSGTGYPGFLSSVGGAWAGVRTQTVSGSTVPGSNVTSSIPFTWTTGDIIEVEGSYEWQP